MVRSGVCCCCILMALVATGCHGFGPPAAFGRSGLVAMALAERLGEQFTIELESPACTGWFDAVWRVDGGELRLQLFPDVGGKVLDLVASPERVRCDTPGASYEAVPPFDRAEPHLALVLAVMLGELAARPTGVRVVGERATSDGRTEVMLEPALHAGEVVAVAGPDRSVLRYDFAVGWLAWSLGADGGFEGRGCRGRLCP